MGSANWDVDFGFISLGRILCRKILEISSPIACWGNGLCSDCSKSFSILLGHDLLVWWPESIMILSQIFIASSIGSRFQRSMFIGIRKTFMIAFVSTIGLIIAMFACAYLWQSNRYYIVNICFGFCSWGVAEMATTAVVLHADSTFVVTVQVLRIVVVILILPPFFQTTKSKRFATNQVPCILMYE